MLRIFLRAVLAIIGAILVTGLLLRLTVASPVNEAALRMLAGHVVLHAKAIAATPPAERRSSVRDLAKSLGYPVRMEQSTGALDVRSEWRAGELYVVVPVPQTPGQLALGPLPYQRPTELPLAAAVVLVVALAVAWLGLRPMYRRIRSLEMASTRMCKGDFTVRVDDDPNQMMSGIGRSLNQLADRIGQLLSDERDLLRTVAHEVRAPISRMRFRVERIHERVDGLGVVVGGGSGTMPRCGRRRR